MFMRTYRIVTLIDITETKQYRKEPNKDLEREQQQNFQMVLQTIGMRVNPQYRRPPVVDSVDLKTFAFGTDYKGTHRVWTFDFDIEYEYGLADEQGNDAGLVINDLHYVPIIPNLTETVELKTPVFDTQSGNYRNTIIHAL